MKKGMTNNENIKIFENIISCHLDFKAKHFEVAKAGDFA